MPCLIKDPKGRSPYYYASWTTADGRRLKKSTKQTDKAKAWDVLLTYVDVDKAIRAGKATEAQLRKVINDCLARTGERTLQDPNVKELLEGWIADKRGSAAESTLRAYQQTKERFLEFLGPRADRGIRFLKKADVVAFRDSLRAEGLTPTTVNKIVKLYLPGPFETARRRGLLDVNPFAVVARLKEQRKEKDTFNREMVATLIEAARGTDWEGAILAGYTTGARLGDVANLRWSAIDTENGVLSFVARKTNKRAIVGLHDDLRDWIVSRPVPDDPDALLFPRLANRPTGGTYGLCAEFSAIMQKAGIEGKVLRALAPGQRGRTVRSLSFHSFRHGAATAVFANAALADIARRVTGHAGKGSLHRYIHDDLVAIRAATNLIPRVPKRD
jgi:integrase